MNWKRRVRRNLLFALLIGVSANAIYFGLLFTKVLHGFAVGALGPAIELVYRYVAPIYRVRPYGNVEELAVNIVLYTFWIFIVLLGIDVLRHLTRKLLRRLAADPRGSTK
jgi:hypothetical protein